MKLKQYIDGLAWGESRKLAINLGISASFLSQIASGAAKVPLGQVLAIENATRGAVTRKEMLPDTWQKYWLPEELEYTAKRRREAEQ